MTPGLPAKVSSVVAVLLLIAVTPLPYGYYTFIRLVVCLSAVFVAYSGLVSEDKSLRPWFAVALALIFNPLIPVHLNKGVWMYLDVAAAVFFGTLAYKASCRIDPLRMSKEPLKQKDDPQE